MSGPRTPGITGVTIAGITGVTTAATTVITAPPGRSNLRASGRACRSLSDRLPA